MVLIGIDPGSSGGIADYDTVTKLVSAKKMPDTDSLLLDYLSNIKKRTLAYPEEQRQIIVLMEQVGGFIGKRKKTVNIVCPHCKKYVPYEIEEADPASRMFKFGEGFGKLQMACLGLRFRVETPMVPKSWQKIHGLYKPSGIAQNAWKNILKDRAQKLFPSIRVTLSTADALLILDVLMRQKLKNPQ